MTLADLIGYAITGTILATLHTWHVSRIKARNRAEWKAQGEWLQTMSGRLVGIKAENRAALDLARAADRMRDDWAESSPERQQELWTALHEASDALRDVTDAHHADAATELTRHDQAHGHYEEGK